jgi:hypothetical protein
MVEKLVFEDKDPIEVPVSVRGIDYVLCEATGDVAVKFANRKLENIQLGPGGKPQSVKGMGDVEPFLVSLCLFEAGSDGKADKTKPVKATDIRKFSSKTMSALFAKAKEISEIDQPTTVEDIDKQIVELNKQRAELIENGTPAKNEQSETTDG